MKDNEYKAIELSSEELEKVSAGGNLECRMPPATAEPVEFPIIVVGGGDPKMD